LSFTQRPNILLEVWWRRWAKRSAPSESVNTAVR